MNRKYHVKLSAEERQAIHERMNSGETAAAVRKRCNILLHADENAGKPPTQEEISVSCGASDVTVYAAIKEYDTQGMEYCLRKRIHKTPPNPPLAAGEKEARIRCAGMRIGSGRAFPVDGVLAGGKGGCAWNHGVCQS